MHIHFIGIGGISMSGLASILLNQHFKVSGSDAHESELTKQLEAEGAILYYGQRASNLDDTPDLVVYTAAHPPGQSGICRCGCKTDPDALPC